MNQRLVMLNMLCCLLFFSACDKNSKSEYSRWTVNGENFSTNNVEATIGKVVAILSSNEEYNGFTITFATGFSLPNNGSYQMLYSPANNDPSIVSIGFFIKGIGYVPSQTPKTFLSAFSNNGKARYTIEPTWFINYNTRADSVLIKGEFNEP